MITVQPSVRYNTRMDPKDVQKRLDAAHHLLAENTTSLQQFESVRTLLKGIDPTLDTALARYSRAISDITRLKDGDLIPVITENLPEEDQDDKRRKKRILAFIKSWQQLHQEYHRVRKELGHDAYRNAPKDTARSFIRIIKDAKGTFGIITIVAVIAVGANALYLRRFAPPVPDAATTEAVIVIDGHDVPLSQVKSAIGTECDGAEHYHAVADYTVIALDGTIIRDPQPAGCGFGKTDEVEILHR